MASKQFQNILHHIANLNYAQLKKLRHEVESNIATNQVGQAIADHEKSISHCAHCDSHNLNRWGMTKQGIQRFKCKSCNKTFNALADSPLYRMKKAEKWIEYTKLMWEGVSLRKSAKALNITLRTSFRWRHMFIKAPASFNPSVLTGVIEADETFLPESFKGKRVINRKSRKRGGGKIGKVPIFIALDRSGVISHKVLERNTKENIQAQLKPLLSSGSVLCTDGNLSYKGIAKELDIDHKRLIGLDNQRVVEGIYHIQTLNNYMMRWKAWLRRFNGIGTDYIENYLSWFRFMEDNTEYSDQTWIKEAL
ncbi:IS1595 family transposase [Pseudoalteromonas sp. ASV78]|uniref:IS1595 family transposase n=1 Tax=Pseudoalteromonas sp. ASV78 TaxID=3397851 RepID=UPI0039FC7C12